MKEACIIFAVSYTCVAFLLAIAGSSWMIHVTNNEIWKQEFKIITET